MNAKKTGVRSDYKDKVSRMTVVNDVWVRGCVWYEVVGCFSKWSVLPRGA